jgi:hypothetical protein
VSNPLKWNLGNNVEITWQDQTGKKIIRSVTLPTLEGKGGILGESIKNKPNGAHDSSFVLEKYKSFFISNPMILFLPLVTIVQVFVPYLNLIAPRYELSVLRSSFPIFAMTLFSLWYINFYVGIFNALPIGTLYRGQLYNSLIKSKTKSSPLTTNRVKIAITSVTIMIIIMLILLPWIIR